MYYEDSQAVAWPEGYSGWAGVEMYEDQASSRRPELAAAFRMAVSGLQARYLYLAFQTAMWASWIDVWSLASRWAARHEL